MDAGKFRTVGVPGRGAACRVGNADQRSASAVSTTWGGMGHEAVRGRQVVGMGSERVAGIGSGVGNVRQAGVLGDGGTAVVPESRAAKRVELTDGSTTGRVVAASRDGIAGVSADKATSIGRVAALWTAGGLVAGVEQRVWVEDPVEEVFIDLVDHPIDVEVSAEILRRLFAIELKHHRVGRV